MADIYEDEKTAPVQKDTMKGFESFKLKLADILTCTTVIRLATLFEYPPRIIEELKGDKNRNHDMITHMEERGQIKPTDITQILNGLKTLDLLGTESRVRKLFEDHTGVRCTGSHLKQQREGKMGLLIRLLKIKYKVLYDAVQPLPYVKDRMLCVDKVFIQGKIQRKRKDERGNESWKSVESYHDILTQSMNESTRCTILGDPGYGKSTLSLQFIYDWCNQVHQSPLQDIDIVIFLRMRQLGRLSSIYQAIKQLLLPTDCSLTVDDIKTVLRNTNSTVIFFDGYDEYPDKSNENTDFNEILKMKKLVDTHVIVTTRSTHIRETPVELKTQSIQFQLTGFTESDQDEYIMKAVVAGDSEAVLLLRTKINENPVLDDMCQIPLFFTIAAHVAHDKKNIISNTRSVTWFFHFMKECFFKHTTNKQGSDDVRSDIARDQLSRVAFDGLAKENQQLVWKKHFLVEVIGETSYNTLIRTGILMEDEDIYIVERVGMPIFFQQCITTSFYHKLFCESYAAFYLVDLIRSMEGNVNVNSASNVVTSLMCTDANDLLFILDQRDLQYLFRFACGLDPKVGCVIIDYLVKQNDENLAHLCLLEFEGEGRNIADAVKALCSRLIEIGFFDSKIQQRATVRLLEIASRCNIPISKVYLVDCCPRFDEFGLILKSGLSLSILSSLQRLEICDHYRRLTNEEFLSILGYSAKSTSLKELHFRRYELPETVAVRSIPRSLKSRKFKVWNRSNNHLFNLTTGLWQRCDLDGDLPEEEN